MKTPYGPLISALCALALAACATQPFATPVEVTRFVTPSWAQLTPGTISIIPAPGFDPQSLEFARFRDLLARELEMEGYSVVESGSQFVATLALSQRRQEAARQGPVTVGGGASVGSYGSGVGLGVGIDLSGQRSDQVHTTLAVTIRPAAGGANLWEGRAVFAASTNHALADPAAAARHALEALFTGFPGNSGETVEVR